MMNKTANVSSIFRAPIRWGQDGELGGIILICFLLYDMYHVQLLARFSNWYPFMFVLR